MIRVGMSNLISKVRTLLNDAASADVTAVFDDQEIQDCLDEHRKEYRYEELTAVPTIRQGGSVVYLDYKNDMGSLEGISYGSGGSASYYSGTAGITLVDSSWGTVTPVTQDCNVGRWSFTSEPSRPVMLVGFAYDRYGAAADLLEKNTVRVSEHFDFKDADQQFMRSQKQKQIISAIERYRALQWLETSELVTQGVNPVRIHSRYPY